MDSPRHGRPQREATLGDQSESHNGRPQQEATSGRHERGGDDGRPQREGTACTDSPRDGRPQWQATLGDHIGRPQWHATGSPWNTRAPGSHTHPMSTPTANSPRCQLAANPFNKCSPKCQRPLARIRQKHGLRLNPVLSRLRAEEDKLPFRKRRVPCRPCTLPSSVPRFLGNL